MTSAVNRVPLFIRATSQRPEATCLIALIALAVGASVIPCPMNHNLLRAEDNTKNHLDLEATSIPTSDPDLFPEFLTKPTHAHFEDRPVVEALQYLSKLHGVTIELHEQEFKAHGMTIDEKITLNADQLTFEQALKLICSRSNLQWRVEGNVIHINVPYAQNPSCRQFNLHDLISKGHSRETLFRTAEMGLSRTAPHQDSKTAWIGDILLLNADYHDARRISRVFACLRQPHERTTVIGDRTGCEQIETDLNKPCEVDVENQPLPEILKLIADQYQIPIFLDKQSLEAFGVTLDAPVTYFRNSLSLGEALRDLLASVELSYLVTDGVVYVTPADYLENHQILTVYDVHDLVKREGVRSQLCPAVISATGANWQLDDDDGGDMVLTEVNDLLIVRHNPAVQREFQSLLPQLRINLEKAHGDKAIAEQKRTRMTTTLYVMRKDAAVELLTKIPKFVCSDQWGEVDGETPAIDILPAEPTQEIFVGEVTGVTDEVRVTDVTPSQPVVDPATPAAPPQKITQTMITRPRAAIAIRQTRETHRQIRKFLRALGTDYQSPTDESSTNQFLGESPF